MAILIRRGVGPASAAYTPQGIAFSSTAYLAKGSALSGASDSKTFLISFWLKMISGDVAQHNVIEITNRPLLLQREFTGKIRLQVFNASATVIGDVRTTATTFNAGMAWTHFLLSGDLAASRLQLYVNDVSDADVVTNTNDTIAWSTNAVNALVGQPVEGANGNLADVYCHIGASLDLSTTSNRRKFIDGSGNAVDLGSDGSTPTSSQPILFFHGAVSGWETNDGSGGGMTISGAGSPTISAAATNPP